MNAESAIGDHGFERGLLGQVAARVLFEGGEIPGALSFRTPKNRRVQAAAHAGLDVLLYK